MVNKHKNDNVDDFESKEGKIKRNEWRKLTGVVVALIALYILNTYNIFEHTGYLLGIVIVAMCGLVTNYIINKIFSLFID